MKLKFEIILLFLSIICYAHKDKVIEEKEADLARQILARLELSKQKGETAEQLARFRRGQ